MNTKQMDNLILDSGMPFLVARRNFWINGADEEIHFSEMDNNYLKHCYTWSTRWEKENTIEEEIGYLKEISNSDKEQLQEYMNQLARTKAEELTSECRHRNLK